MDMPENLWVRPNDNQRKTSGISAAAEAVMAPEPTPIPEVGQTMLIALDRWGAYAINANELVDGGPVAIVEVKSIHTASVKTTTELV